MKTERKIKFRCWYCNKRYGVDGHRVGEKFECTCQRRVRVPRRSDGSSRCRSPMDWFLEIVLYGGGGALLGFLLAVFVLSRLGVRYHGWSLVLVSTVIGLGAGVLGGERGLDWIGSIIRDREQD